jgi:hypothetical protein
MPNVAAMAAAPIVPMPVIPWADVNHLAGISVVVVRIVPISVSIRIISVAVPVSDGHTNADSDVHPRLCLGHACEGESPDGDREQKKLFPVHNGSSVNFNND